MIGYSHSYDHHVHWLRMGVQQLALTTWRGAVSIMIWTLLVDQGIPNIASISYARPSAVYNFYHIYYENGHLVSAYITYSQVEMYTIFNPEQTIFVLAT